MKKIKKEALLAHLTPKMLGQASSQGTRCAGKASSIRNERSKSALWWDESWNPVTGCTAVSEGCAHCYAKAMHERLFQSTKFEKIVLHPERLDKPSRMKAGKVIFVDSMSDLFHEDVPFCFIADVLWVMIDNPQHTFVVLTKRPERMLEFFGEWIFKGKTKPLPSKNVWFGVTAENQARADERIPLLLKAPVQHWFVSVEPMLGEVDLSEWVCAPQQGLPQQAPTSAIELVICGGESGTGARPMQPDWARALRDQCVDAGVPFYFKQWGEWAPRYSKTPLWNFTRWVCKGANHIGPGDICVDMTGKILRNGWDFEEAVYPVEIMVRSSRNDLGRMLDGREWNELPWRKPVEKSIDQPAEVQLELIQEHLTPAEHLTPTLSNGVVEGALQEDNL